jgi:transposase
MEGYSPEAVVKSLGFSRQCIYNWLARYRNGGWDGLKTGSRTGRPRKLNGKQIAWIDRTVREKDPMQLVFPFALWTRERVAKLIHWKYGIKLSVSSAGRLMRMLGLTCQKPLYRAYQQNPEATDLWMKVEYPKIVARANRENASIFFEDESGVRSDHHAGKTWAPKGERPVVKTTGSRFSVNMIGAVTHNGTMGFMTVKGTIKAPQICEFLNRLMSEKSGKVFVIWDGHPTHSSKAVRACIDSFEGRLEVFTLPSYSPQLNPAEQIWKFVKHEKVGRSVITGPDQFMSLVRGALRSLQRLPGIVRSFFHHPHCSYSIRLCP